MNQAAIPEDEPTFSGAVAPERVPDFDSFGTSLRLSEWGDPAAPAIVLCHGMFDHGRGFATLAPLLAERFRVIALDHGDSDWCDAYTWPMDVTDVVNVVRSLDRPVHLVGHSRGRGLATDAAVLLRERVAQLVNIDGFGPPPEGFPIPGVPQDASPLAERFASLLEDRRRAHPQPGTHRPGGLAASGCATPTRRRRQALPQQQARVVRRDPGRPDHRHDDRSREQRACRVRDPLTDDTTHGVPIVA